MVRRFLWAIGVFVVVTLVVYLVGLLLVAIGDSSVSQISKVGTVLENISWIVGLLAALAHFANDWYHGPRGPIV